MSIVAAIGPGEVRYIEPYALFVVLPERHARMQRCMATTKGEIRSGEPFEVHADASWNIEVLVPDGVKLTTHPMTEEHQSAMVRLVFPDGQIIEKGAPVPEEYIVG